MTGRTPCPDAADEAGYLALRADTQESPVDESCTRSAGQHTAVTRSAARRSRGDATFDASAVHVTPTIACATLHAAARASAGSDGQAGDRIGVPAGNSPPPKRARVAAHPAVRCDGAHPAAVRPAGAPHLHIQDDSGLQRVAPGGLPGSRKAAQYLDLAAAVASTPVFSGVASAARGATSGALWSASAGFSAYNNQQDVRQRHESGESTGAMGWSNRVADGSSFLAGASDASSSVFNYFGSSSSWAATASTATAYASNAFWGVAGAIGFGQGVANWRDSAKSKLASGLQMAGGLLNVAGAGFGAVAAQRQSADPNDPAATYYGYASAAAWTFGSLATIASNHIARRAENAQFAPDVEGGR